MANCIICNTPVVSGFVVHGDCSKKIIATPISVKIHMPEIGERVVIYWGENIDIGCLYIGPSEDMSWNAQSFGLLEKDIVEFWAPIISK